MSVSWKLPAPLLPPIRSSLLASEMPDIAGALQHAREGKAPLGHSALGQPHTEVAPFGRPMAPRVIAKRAQNDGAPRLVNELKLGTINSHILPESSSRCSPRPTYGKSLTR